VNIIKLAVNIVRKVIAILLGDPLTLEPVMQVEDEYVVATPR
jgi:hypothetical protein